MNWNYATLLPPARDKTEHEAVADARHDGRLGDAGFRRIDPGGKRV
jgi:hypothetical protein